MKKIVPVLAAALLVAACAGDAGDTTTTQAAAVDSTTTSVAETTTTRATTTSEAGSGTISEAPSIPVEPYVEGENPDADALHDLYTVAFDSSTAYDEKAPLIDDTVGLEGVVDAYASTGDQVGGISLEVTATGVEGDTAAVMYNLLFADNPFQLDLLGTATRVDGTWKVTREYFCEIMIHARVPCS